MKSLLLVTFWCVMAFIDVSWSPSLRLCLRLCPLGWKGLRWSGGSGEISRRCTRVLHLWWSGLDNYIRGTTRAPVLLSCFSPHSVPFSACSQKCFMHNSWQNATRHPSNVIGPAVRDMNFCAFYFSFIPFMVHQKSEEDLWCGTSQLQHLHVTSHCWE